MTPKETQEILEKLLDLRNDKFLFNLDERYQKGYRDAIDMFIKWLLK